MNAQEQRIIERVRKLLRLGNKTNTPITIKQKGQ